MSPLPARPAPLQPAAYETPWEWVLVGLLVLLTLLVLLLFRRLMR